jgi:hypothetical protein
MSAQDSPATIDDLADGGDEVQRRFRYQINYCALKALQLLRPTAEFCAIYCEHIEGLLIESLDGAFIGIQIKTRELDRGHFKSNEPTIVNTLSRFCVRDARFPNWFSAFILATNFVFYRGDGVDDLRNVLACTRKDPTLASLGPRDRIRKYLQGLAEHTKLSVEAVIGTLAKLSLEERHTGVDQPDFEIIHALGEITPFSQLRWHQLLLGVRLLRGRVWDGSSLALEGFALETHDITADFDAHLRRLQLAHKRIDAEEIAAVLNPANTADAAQNCSRSLAIWNEMWCLRDWGTWS